MTFRFNFQLDEKLDDEEKEDDGTKAITLYVILDSSTGLKIYV